ncbi:MAG: zinc-dependent metalloprotease, partial [Calditrichia bacterium]
KPDQFETIYLMNLTRESGDGSLFGGAAMLGSFPFYFQRVGKKVQMLEKNVRFRAEENQPMERAIQRNLSNSVFASAKIASQPHPERGSILIDASDLFLKDVAGVSQQSGKAKMGYSFDKSNSYFSKLKSFPRNSDVEVTLHFKSSKPQKVFTLADSKSMFHRYYYSILTLPETGYKPRLADDRVGHFLTMYQDYNSVLSDDPYRRYVNRWHLVKAEPKFKLSPPVEPIVFWLENTIPVEYRDAVRRGILLWNPAFEKIGFKDAIVVKQMPDDADWDPADARYNTIRWMVEPGASYAAGPSTANPFTGQIYDADIRVSADMLRVYYREFEEVINPNLQGTANESYFLKSILAPKGRFSKMLPLQCNIAAGMSHQIGFGWNLLLSRGAENEEDLQKFLNDAIVDLIAHEVGHTLGLRHNFKASTIYSLDKLNDIAFTDKNGLTGSVMDYNPTNIAVKGEPQGSYFHTTLGPYDYWAIEYAYKPLDPASKKSEEEMLEEIARRVADPKLQYGTDEDALGFSTRSIDPTSSYWDLGSDALQFYQNRVVLTKDLWRDLPENFDKKGERYQKLRLAFNQGLTEYAIAATNICKFIGGIYNYRDHIGDPHGRIPFRLVPAEKQRQALKFLVENIFARDAFQFSPDLLNKLAAERFWDFEGTVFRMSRIDYPIHGIVQVLQSVPMNRLYDFTVLQRIQDNEVKFKKGEEPFRMSELFQGIRKAVWEELENGENINSYRRELQRMHLNILLEMVVRYHPVYPHDAVTLARADLVNISEKIAKLSDNPNLDAYTSSHLQETAAKIDAALKAQVMREF